MEHIHNINGNCPAGLGSPQEGEEDENRENGGVEEENRTNGGEEKENRTNGGEEKENRKSQGGQKRKAGVEKNRANKKKKTAEEVAGKDCNGNFKG